ncbi:Mannose-6-phosphate isomerase [Plasmodium coatneyi]|uniref:Mannose-6-phosphate isomerase n=1 Tax=Plasmodium coatneyi TaxID=208452 RepID=A0A1B1DSU5_9APIC|nr:Mannose-6-phosphate isomerase [Plasmodium coatneyi]ANQ05853.1 Mannose-6-phosphate isomerase [Plasmodium coatneyi]
MKTRKLCINECIPYVQKYEWGEGKDGMVYDVMKNILKENYDLVKKDIHKVEYIKEYMPNPEEEKRKKKEEEKRRKKEEQLKKKKEQEEKKRKKEEEKRKKKEEQKRKKKGEASAAPDQVITGVDIAPENVSPEDKSKESEQNSSNGKDDVKTNDEAEPKYAELWIGNHEKGPNLVLYKNNFIKIEKFLQIYEAKEKKKGKISKYFSKKNENAKDKDKNKGKDKDKNKKNSTKSEDVNAIRDKEADGKRHSDTEISSLNNYSLYEKYDIVKEDIDKNTLFPYLFKLLSISKPLSIQIHPNEVQTLYLNTLNPNLYKDKVFKTEMCVCINSMSLLCGFMNIFKIAFLVTRVRELHDFFLKRENPRGGSSETGSGGSCNEEPVQGSPSVEQSKDIFHLFDLFHTQKNEHVEELMRMLARIYIYIINYSLKRGSTQTYDVLSVVDNYAECIQKYVFDEGFFAGFYRNKKFLEQNINLGNLIKVEKEKLQNSGDGRGVSSDDEEEDEVLEEQLEVDVKGGVEVGSKAQLQGESMVSVSTSCEDPEAKRTNRQAKKKNKGVPLNAEGGAEVKGKVEMNGDIKREVNDVVKVDGAVRSDKKQDLQCASQPTSRKKIQSFYEHVFKYLTYRTMLVEGDLLNKCLNDIEAKNEKYKSYLKEKELLKKSPEEIYADVCKKKNYKDVQAETENFIISNIFDIFYNISKFYPNDGGRIFIFILQQLNLKDGDVVYIKPGVIHSYISGHCLECMTNSDLVIRGGLTNKEVDKLNFIKYVNYKRNFPIILEKEFINYNIISYSYYKLKHFRILFLTVRPGESVTFLFSEVSFTSCIVLSSNRTVKIKGRKNEKKKASIKGVKKGSVFFIAPSIHVTLANFYKSEADGDKELVLYCATS